MSCFELARGTRLTRLALLSLLIAGCSATGGKESVERSAHPYAGWVRRLSDAVELGVAAPELLARSIEHVDPTVRREAARAIGVLAPADGVILLIPHIGSDDEREVRIAAIYALGLLTRSAAFPPLAGILADDPDPILRRHAAVAIGRLEGDGVEVGAVEALIAALSDPDHGVRGGAALAVWHHGQAAPPAIAALTAHLSDRDDEVRWRVAYALMRIEDPRTLPALRERLSDPHPWVRTFAAWGMRQPPDPEAIEPLGALLSDRTSGSTARVEALRSLGAIRKAHPDRSDQIRGHLLEHMLREQDAGAWEALLSALAVEGGSTEAEFIEEMIDRREPATARRAAIRAFGEAAKQDSLDRLAVLATDDDPYVRIAVADALGRVGVIGGPLLASLLREDDDARVRAAAAEAIAGIVAPFRWPLLETVVADPDLAVRSTAVGAIAKEKPDRWLEILIAAWGASQDPEHWELRVTILEALAEPEGDTAAMFAEEGILDPFLAVRLASAKILGREAPTAAEAPPPRGLPFPRLDDPFAPAENPRATIVTERGALVLELYLDAAPRHVSGFIGQVERGTYDGLPFHRVVPSFVVQGADPRRDGWGDAGYHLVDEFNPIEYTAGTLGMPRAGHHTGGCQIFITHLPTPHLDGRYTVFGGVIEGLEVLDRIEVGDLILKVTVDGFDAPRRAAF